MSKNFVRRQQEQLVHGAEIVANFLGATTVDEMDKVFELTDKEAERRFYTVDFIFQVLAQIGRTADERRHLLDAMGRMLAFDALIGAPDRHALNWGLIQSRIRADVPWRFAPIFDTARGLFGESRESALVELDAKGRRKDRIGSYAEKSKPVFGCAAGHDVNHFQLVEHCVREGPPEVATAMRQVIRAFSQARTERLIQRRFQRIITRRRIGWITELLQVRSSRLRLLVG
jgi:hypothetical protein